MRLTGLVARTFRPRGTVRLRMTILFGGLFLLCGALVLALASGLVVRSSSSRVSNVARGAHAGGQPVQASLAQADQRIKALQAALNNAVKAQSGAHSVISHQLLVASAIALAVMVGFAVVLGWIFAGRSLRPLRLITATARRISEDNLHERLALAGPNDELKDLADTFDDLLERLEAAFAAQRRFVANASHELRTPLTTMRAALDVAMAKPNPPPPQTVALAARLQAELDRIDELLDGFLALARAQHGALPGRELIALDAVVAGALDASAAAIRDVGLTLTTGPPGAGAPAGSVPADPVEPGPAMIAGSQPLVRRMVDNVLENAIVHNEAGGWISVSTQARGDLARIVIENGGPVLDQQQVGQLAQPFRRLGLDRVGSDKGSGLGLSIVAAIAGAHGGNLDLIARRGGGLRVVIELPLARQSGQAALARSET
jgi:signal transduction histidine kinase